MAKKNQGSDREKDNDLLEYHNDLINQAIASADANESLPADEFYTIATSLLSEAGMLNNVSEEDSFHHRDSKFGTEIDGWSWNLLEKTIYGIVTEFNSDPQEIQSINRKKLETLGTRVARLFENVEKESFLEKISYDEAATLNEIKDLIDEAIKFRVVILTNHETTVRVRNTGIKLDKIHGKETSIEVWDLSKLMELDYGGLDSVPTLINFEELYGAGLPALIANSTELSQQSYLCVLPAQYLSDLYHEYGQRLLQSNVRSFLEFRGLSNKGMRDTLLREPENFFTYNNGITVTASSHQTRTIGKKMVITELENMQIVNGGQTTAVIYFAPKEAGGPRTSEGILKWNDIDLSKVFVQMKLTILDDEEEAPIMTSKISQFSNTQAAVTKADLISNHPLHLRIEKMSRKTSVSGPEGIPAKWFYERSRGQYTVQLRQRRTPARKKQFQAEYPKKQKFVKTDMAKYENTWRMNPDQVSQGAQKNLQLLGEDLVKEWEKNEDAFRETFFQDLIAKAILFKTLDTEINKAQWYKESRGYKAQAVTYSIAMLRHLLHRQDKEINLKRIYSNQALSEAFLSEALKLSRHTRDQLMDEDFRGANANISQFAKKQTTWHKVREIDYHLEIPDEDLLNKEQQQEHTYEAKKLGEAGAQIDFIERVLEVSLNEWVELLDYLQKEEGFPYGHKKVKMIELCISLHRGLKIPTENQAKAALQIREDASSNNFSYFE